MGYQPRPCREQRDRSLWWKISLGALGVGGFVTFLCVMFCTKETVVQVVDLHWTHEVTLQQYREWEDCGVELETDMEGNSHMVPYCRTESTWDTIGEWKHEGDNFKHVTWPPDPPVHGRQRILHDATYRVRVRNDEGKWLHSTSNLPWAQRFAPGQLWLAKVNRAGMAWPERPAGAEE